MTEVNDTPWADGERAELVSKLKAAIDADPASEEFKTLFLKVLEAHSIREAFLLKSLEEAKAELADYFSGEMNEEQKLNCVDQIDRIISAALSTIQKDQK